jgi:hypothetical protein
MLNNYLLLLLIIHLFTSQMLPSLLSPHRVLPTCPLLFETKDAASQASSFPRAWDLSRIRCVLSRWDQTRQFSATYVLGDLRPARVCFGWWFMNNYLLQFFLFLPVTLIERNLYVVLFWVVFILRYLWADLFLNIVACL